MNIIYFGGDKMSKKTKTYVISILTALAVGGLSALLTKGNMNIYSDIVTPPLTPPSMLFPIVWSVLYILMGISAAMIFLFNKKEYKNKINDALYVYAAQLLFNFFWSIWFFNVRAFLFSFIWLIAMWVLIIIMIVKFSKINKCAAYLQIPYLIWTTFAAYLNLAIYILNRS